MSFGSFGDMNPHAATFHFSQPGELMPGIIASSAPVGIVAAISPPQPAPEEVLFHPADSGPLRCKWTNPPCNLVFQDAVALYEHLKEAHVGRKSTNNLCLQCAWEGCNARVRKRDHMTSHVKVHVPLKDCICQVCGRGFKRPQDLKKHEKLHNRGEANPNSSNIAAASGSSTDIYSPNTHPLSASSSQNSSSSSLIISQQQERPPQLFPLVINHNLQMPYDEYRDPQQFTSPLSVVSSEFNAADSPNSPMVAIHQRNMSGGNIIIPQSINVSNMVYQAPPQRIRGHQRAHSDSLAFLARMNHHQQQQQVLSSHPHHAQQPHTIVSPLVMAGPTATLPTPNVSPPRHASHRRTPSGTKRSMDFLINESAETTSHSAAMTDDARKKRVMATNNTMGLNSNSLPDLSSSSTSTSGLLAPPPAPPHGGFFAPSYATSSSAHYQRLPPRPAPSAFSSSSTAHARSKSMHNLGQVQFVSGPTSAPPVPPPAQFIMTDVYPMHAYVVSAHPVSQQPQIRSPGASLQPIPSGGGVDLLFVSPPSTTAASSGTSSVATFGTAEYPMQQIDLDLGLDKLVLDTFGPPTPSDSAGQ